MSSRSLPLPRTLILDYYDSYTNNLLTLFTQLYSDAEVLRKVVVIKADRFSWEEFQSNILPSIDCVILSPGPGRPDNPPDIGFALQLLREVAAGPRNLPVLGVCLGHQAIGVAFGGKIINTPKITHGHVVPITPTSSQLGPFSTSIWTSRGSGSVFDVVVYNSLTVDPQSIPQVLDVTATGSEGRTVQGMAHKGDGRIIWGVQFHPESIASSQGCTLLQAYINAVHTRYSNPSSFPSLPATLTGACSFRAPESATAPPSPTLQPIDQPASGKLALVEKKFGSLGKDVLTQDAFERIVRQRRKGKGREDQPGIGEVWLDGESPNFPTTTSLTIPTFLITYSLSTGTVSLHRPGLKPEMLRLNEDMTFFDWLATGQRRIERVTSDHSTRGASSVGGWRCGWVGWFAYEMKEESLAGYRRRLRSKTDKVEIDACWAYSCEILERSGSGEWIARGVVSDGGPIGAERVEQTTESGDLDMLSWFRRLGVSLASKPEDFQSFAGRVEMALDDTLAQDPRESPADAIPEFSPRDNGPDYMSRIDQCRDAIRRGESYELTMTTAFEAANPSPEDNYPLYLKLRALNPSYYSSYLSFPCIDLSVCSSSPERFMRINKDREVDMKPIKGTRARVKAGQCVCVINEFHVKGNEACVARAQEEDRERARELQENVKERAENLMIVDLIRADLLSCCVPSSVTVPKLIAVESYESVHNLVTTVSGKLMDSVGSIEAIQRCFPPGSMTGAPKLRSVQLLDDLENRHQRGIYSGALGYLSLDGSADVAVVIRTIVCQPEKLTIGAGGAITWLSDRDSEWDEVLLKVKSVTGRRFA